MTQKGTVLTPRQAAFVAALADGNTVTTASRLARIARKTAYRYLRLPHVRAEISQRLDALLAEASLGLASDLKAARATLRAIMDDRAAPPGSRVSAAGRTLDAGMKLIELQSLAARVSELEEAIERKQR
jgi:phage terminase small subunit